MSLHTDSKNNIVPKPHIPKTPSEMRLQPHDHYSNSTPQLAARFCMQTGGSGTGGCGGSLRTSAHSAVKIEQIQPPFCCFNFPPPLPLCDREAVRPPWPNTTTDGAQVFCDAGGGLGCCRWQIFLLKYRIY